MLSDTQWAPIADLLPAKPTDKGGWSADYRLFVQAVGYTVRVENPWCGLPDAFGNQHSVCTRFTRWGVGGVRERTDEAFKDEADLEALFKFGTEQMEELRDFVLMSGRKRFAFDLMQSKKTFCTTAK